MKITSEQARHVRNYINKKVSYQKKSSYTTLFDKNGEQTVDVLNCLITWVIPQLKILFKNLAIKNNFIQASLSDNRIHKKLIPIAVECNFCDDQGLLYPPIAAIIRSYFWSKQLKTDEQNDNLYLVKIVQSYYDYLPK